MKLYGKDEGFIREVDLLRAIETEEINGEFGLECTTLYYTELTEGCYLGYEDKFFEITTAETLSNKTIEIYARHISQELKDDFVEDIRPTGSAETVLNALLSGTRWTVGTVSDLGSTQVFFYRESVFSGLAKVANIFKGELQFRVITSGTGILTRYVDLLEFRGEYNGKRFEYDKDIEEIVKKVDTDNLITACYGYGAAEEIETEEGVVYGRRIDFGDVVWTTPSNKPLGDNFVADSTALSLWGRDGRHRYGKIEFDDVSDPEELLLLTWGYLQANNEPRISYAMNVFLLGELAGFEHEKVNLGDTVVVKDNEINVLVTARVLRLQRNLLIPEQSRCVLANFIDRLTGELSDTIQFVNRFRDKQGAYDIGTVRAIDGLDESGYVALPIHGGRIINDDVEDGLNYNNTYMGYYNLAQDAWRAYIDNQGRFLFQRDADSYFKYDGTEFEFKGKVIASEGAIGGWEITANEIKSTDNSIILSSLDKSFKILSTQTFEEKITSGDLEITSISITTGFPVASRNACSTGFFPVANGDVIATTMASGYDITIYWYDTAKNYIAKEGWVSSLNKTITQDGYIRFTIRNTVTPNTRFWMLGFTQTINMTQKIEIEQSESNGFVFKRGGQIAVGITGDGVASAFTTKGTVDGKDVKITVSPEKPFELMIDGQKHCYIKDGKFITSKYDVLELGHVANSGYVAIKDYFLASSATQDNTFNPRFDINNSGAISLADYIELKQNLPQPDIREGDNTASSTVNAWKTITFSSEMVGTPSVTVTASGYSSGSVPIDTPIFRLSDITSSGFKVSCNSANKAFNYIAATRPLI